jgi:hypothetical protein
MFPQKTQDNKCSYCNINMTNMTSNDITIHLTECYKKWSYEVLSKDNFPRNFPHIGGGM